MDGYHIRKCICFAIIAFFWDLFYIKCQGVTSASSRHVSFNFLTADWEKICSIAVNELTRWYWSYFVMRAKRAV